MQNDRLLRLRECAERSGNSIATWRAWIAQRKIPYHKLGRSVRVSERDLEALIQAARVSAREVRQ